MTDVAERRPTQKGALSGLIPVLATPFDLKGNVVFDEFIVGIEHAIEAGSDGVMTPGFASEFHKLDAQERSELEHAMLATVARYPHARSVVSVPDHSSRLAIQRAVAAVEAGASAINVLPPFFLSPSSDAVVAHLTGVLEAVAPTPVMLQYAPGQTAGGFALPLVSELARNHDNLVTIKVESSPPGRTIDALGQMGLPLTTLVGYAGLHLIDALRRGTDGVQPGGSFPELYRAILDDWNQGKSEQAESLHRALVSYLSYWMTDVELIVQVEKRIAHLRGWFSADACRQPGRPLDRHELAQVDRFLDEFSAWLP